MVVTYSATGLGAVLLVGYVLMNARTIVALAGRRSSRYGANMIVMIVLVIAIVVIVQALSARHSFRYDLTRNKRFSLAEQTLNILTGLEKDVRVTAFFQSGEPSPARAENLANLPPAYISTMEFDPLRDEGILYGLRLLQAGISVELHSYPGTFHGSALVPTASVSKRGTRETFHVLARRLARPTADATDD